MPLARDVLHQMNPHAEQQDTDVGRGQVHQVGGDGTAHAP